MRSDALVDTAHPFVETNVAPGPWALLGGRHIDLPAPQPTTTQWCNPSTGGQVHLSREICFVIKSQRVWMSSLASPVVFFMWRSVL